MHNNRSVLAKAKAAAVLKEHSITAPPVPINDLIPASGITITHSVGAYPGSGLLYADAWTIRLSSDLFQESDFRTVTGAD